MEATMTLFMAGALQQPGKLLFTCNAYRSQQVEVTVNLCEKGLIETCPKKKQSILFDFDVKYSFLLSPAQITFERNEEKATYLLKSEADVQTWRQILKGKLNQRGFHEQFKPKKKIGKGNFASVYLAEKLENGKFYAVKAFSKEAAYSEDKGKECLIKEIEVMRALNHKYCMRLYEVFESENSLYIVVELLEGGQLYDKVKAKYKFKSHETKTIIYSILSGLKQMHSKKIMHRDLKPQNLIFRSQNSWECIIADFGLAEFSDAEAYLFVRCGTPGYVAPEVINIKDMNTKYEPICDMFSLGLIFHILLLGVSAFPGKTYNQVLAQNRASNICLQSEQYKKLDPEAVSLMAKMLKKFPNQRITAAQALNHPYFKNIDEEEQDQQIGDQVPEMANRDSYTECKSPLLTSANPARKKDKMIKKDSCLDFKMGKENLLTGKVETIAQTGTPQNSMGRKFESFMAPKVSKFSSANKK